MISIKHKIKETAKIEREAEWKRKIVIEYS
jgi:hypothetical protein